MADFTRTNLKLKYSWITEKDKAMAVTGFPRNVIFDSNEGHQVVWFVNRYMESLGWHTQASFNNIELLLRKHLPVGINSHHHVKLWLDWHLTR